MDESDRECITSVTLIDKSLCFSSYGIVMPCNSSSLFFISDARLISAWVRVHRIGEEMIGEERRGRKVECSFD